VKNMFKIAALLLVAGQFSVSSARARDYPTAPVTVSNQTDETLEIYKVAGNGVGADHLGTLPAHYNVQYTVDLPDNHTIRLQAKTSTGGFADVQLTPTASSIGPAGDVEYFSFSWDINP
jgi:hypothetical protein